MLASPELHFSNDLNGSYLFALAQAEALRCRYRYCESDEWWGRVDVRELADTVATFHSMQNPSEALFEDPEGVVYLRSHFGSITCHAYAHSPLAVAKLIEGVRQIAPPEDRESGDPPITFWFYAAHGPSSIRRDVAAPAWSEIADNYAESTIPDLSTMFGDGFRPGHGGQLILWSGEPGTGKTTAIRGLAREWRSWCSMHYIADPEKFFGDKADYMIQVMLQDHGDPGDDEQWRLLILEDTGELLQTDAKAETGQALSRFLNVVDGLIGQGLQVIVLVTTNEQVGQLHPAVSRPGRCALHVEFERLGSEEADAWRVAHDLQPLHNGATLAELYAELESFAGGRERKQTVGFAA